MIEEKTGGGFTDAGIAWTSWRERKETQNVA
jgi:hypothetical protein